MLSDPAAVSLALALALLCFTVGGSLLGKAGFSPKASAGLLAGSSHAELASSDPLARVSSCLATAGCAPSVSLALPS